MAALTAIKPLGEERPSLDTSDTLETTATLELIRAKTDGDVPWGGIVTALASILASVIVIVCLLAVPAFYMVAEISRVGASVDNIDADVEKKVLLLEQMIETQRARIDALNQSLEGDNK